MSLLFRSQNLNRSFVVSLAHLVRAGSCGWLAIPCCGRDKLCENKPMLVGSSALLDALCDRLMRTTAARKVMVCTLDGSVVAHAGEIQVLFGPLVSELAELAADVLIETEQASHLAVPVEDRFGQAGPL